MFQATASSPPNAFGSFFFSKPPSRLYRIERSVCTNPFCGCSSLQLGFWGAAPEDALVPFSVTVDVLSRKQVKRRTKQSPEQDQLAKLFLKELSEQDWAHLKNLFFSDKASIVESFDYDKATYEGLYLDEIDCVDSQREMVSYAALFVTPLEGHETPEGHSHSFLFDYKARTVVPLGPPPTGFPSASEIREALNNTPSTSFTEIKKRNDRVKLVYRKYRQQRGIPANTSTKVGRNEPCPCGSGKKFKLCCGK